jgi:hypothetical protein
LEALDDFMLKVLIVSATVSLIFGYIGADPHDYDHGKSTLFLREYVFLGLSRKVGHRAL